MIRLMNTPDSVDLLRTFWLADPGGQARGPFTLEQIAGMFRSGAIYATAVICEVGTESWRPVTELRREFSALFTGVRAASVASVPVQKSAGYNVGTYRVLALLLGGIGAHNFYASEVGPGILKLVLLAAGGLFSMIGELGLVISWLIAAVVLVIVVIELCEGRSLAHRPQ